MASPEAAGADPEPRQQIVLADLLGLLGRQLRIGLDDLRRRRRDLIAILTLDLDDGRRLALLALCGRLLHARTTQGNSNGSLRVPVDRSFGGTIAHPPQPCRSVEDLRQFLDRIGLLHEIETEASFPRQRLAVT